MTTQKKKDSTEIIPELPKIAATGGAWRELLTRKSVFGNSDFMIYTTDRKYEIVRYNRAADSVDTVLSGVYWDCHTDEQRFEFLMEDFQSLLNTLKEDYANRHRPDTELEEDIKERERLLRYDY